MFGTNIRIKSGMLNCTYILEIVPSLPQGSQTTIQLEHSPKFLAQNKDRIKMFKCTDILEFGELMSWELMSYGELMFGGTNVLDSSLRPSR